MAIVPGAAAQTALQQSGLLGQKALPIEAADVLTFLQTPDSFAVICFKDGVAQGYVVGCIRTMEGQVRELFILQATGDGGSEWVSEGWEALHWLAARLGCRRIGTIFPVSMAEPLARRFKFTPQGVYCTALVRGPDTH
jgi:hypothetical protein